LHRNDRRGHIEAENVLVGIGLRRGKNGNSQQKNRNQCRLRHDGSLQLWSTLSRKEGWFTTEETEIPKRNKKPS
jgi:hypothetical protein